MLKEALRARTAGTAKEKQIFIFGHCRLTVLTPRLIRVEHCPDGAFEDRASTAVWFRAFDVPPCKAALHRGTITLTTPEITLTVHARTGTPQTVTFSNGKTADCLNFGNLHGTCRTLDATFGPVPLQDGLVSRDGVSLLDDSRSFLLDADGRFCPRKRKGKDVYVFAYGHDYRAAIQDFYKISGSVPLIPRFALGVWWSRYHAYTQEEYLGLMKRFAAENVPLTVATVDMDWHWTDPNKRFGTHYKGKDGWTGYSWNTELFPDYKAFLQDLHQMGLHTTVNLHPADGVRAFEDPYPAMAKAMGLDPKTKQDIPFRCGNDTFWNAYFDVLHKPYEKEGVDFWWLDWQQGKKSDVPGLDPLVALNHYHYLDNAENGRLPLILSRYSGPGAHRYPLGFSGDTAQNWRVLHFQPYFTATAANVGYTWWSHDIGGHHLGERNEELYLRWLQLGVFSPILRLHSTSNDLMGKEPWRYRPDVCAAAKDWLRLRHRLIPYLYTMDARTHRAGLALCEPLYYAYPEAEEAYDKAYCNGYLFGSRLLVYPITSPQKKQLGMGAVDAWIPPGRWTDLFTGAVYTGPLRLTLHRELTEMPVLAKAGAILPLSDDPGNACGNPTALTLWLYAGDGDFTLYEDNGQTDFDTHKAETQITQQLQGSTLTMTVASTAGDCTVLPKKRQLTLVFKDLEPSVLTCAEAEVTQNAAGEATVILADYDPTVGTQLHLQGATYRKAVPVKARVLNIFCRWQGSNVHKTECYRLFKTAKTKEKLRRALKRTRLPGTVRRAVEEALLQTDA